MNSGNRKERGRRTFLVIILVIVVVLAGIQLFLSLYLDSYVKDRLTSAVDEQSNGRYELEIGDLDLSIWRGVFQADSIRIHPADTTSTAPKIELGQFSVTGIEFLPYLFSSSVNAGEIKLSGPAVYVTQNSPDSLSFLQSSGQQNGGKESMTVSIDQFIIDEGAVTYFKTDQSGIRGELRDFNLRMSGIHADSSTMSQKPYLSFDTLQASTGAVRYQTNNNLYTVQTHAFNFSTAERYAQIDSLQLIPEYPKYDFSENVGHQLDRISLTIDQMRLEDPDIEKLKSGELDATSFSIEQVNLEVFHSKLLPNGTPEEKTFPQMTFKELNLPVSIDTLTVSNSQISYAEHLPEVSQPGEVTFANVYATFTGVTNDSVKISRGHEITLDVTSDVMGEASLNVLFTFPMQEDDGSHSARGTLQSMGVDELNPVLEPVGLVRAESGTIHSLQFLMDLGGTQAGGWTQLVYSDLDIALLDEKNVEDGGSQRIKSFLANALKVKADNNEDPLRRGEISFERDTTKSIFNYWWKSLSSGLKDNIGL